MESIFHEKQDGSLCAQHCLNALLQGEYFTAVDLATLAQQMDEEERVRMAEAGLNSEEYRRFLQQPSSNMDDSGYFSIQVIASALEVWSLELIPYNSQHPIAVEANINPIYQLAFICNYRDHWFTIRKLGNQWFNLNSVLTGPELISDTYLAMFLAQLQQEGYSIFIVQGMLPECEADQLLRLVPAVQLVKPRLLSEVRAQQENLGLCPSSNKGNHLPDDEDVQLEAAVKLSLQDSHLSSNNSSASNTAHPSSGDPSTGMDLRHKTCVKQSTTIEPPISSNAVNSDHLDTDSNNTQQSSSTANTSAEDLSEEAMLEAALRMSMEQETG